MVSQLVVGAETLETRDAMTLLLATLGIGMLSGAAVWLWTGQSHVGRLGPATQRIPKSPSRQAGPAAPQADEIPLILDLTAAMLSTGLSLTDTLKALSRSVPSCQELARVSRSLELGMEWEQAWRTAPEGFQTLESALAFSRLAGASSASLLRDSATTARRLVHRSFEKKAAELGVKLILPLGLCALPAFMLLGVGPFVMSLLPQ